MAIGVYLQSYKDKTERSLVVIRFRDTGKDFVYPTGIKVLKAHWDSRTFRVKPSNSLHEQLNKKLDELKSVAYSLHDLYKARIITFTQLKNKMNGGSSQVGFDSLWTIYEKEKTTSTLKSYKNAVNAFNLILGKTTSTLEDVEFNTVSRAVSEWKKRGKSPSTINSYVKALGILRNDAFKRGIVESGFRKDRTLIQRVGQPQLETVTSTELLAAVQLAKTDWEVNAVALWILSFITRGLYFADIMELTPKASGTFIHRRTKTGYTMHIDSLDGLILDVYSLVEGLDLSKPRTYQKKLRNVLKKPFKSARKTFDTIALKEGVDVQIRFALLAHSDSTIKKHYSDLNDIEVISQINEAHRKVLRSFGVGKSIMLLYNKLGLELSEGSKRFVFQNG